MTNISIAKTLNPARTIEEILGRLKVSLSTLFRRISARRCLLSELEKIPEKGLQDIGLLQADVISLRETPVLGDSFGQLAARFQERHASC